MATSDLCGELSKGSVELGSQLEIKYVGCVFHESNADDMACRVCTAILNQLNDTSNDVQSIAVKWYVTQSTNVINHNRFA